MVTAEKIVVSAKIDNPIGKPIFVNTPNFDKGRFTPSLKYLNSANGLLR